MILGGKFYFCDILLTDQISLSGCLSFVRYWAVSHKNRNRSKSRKDKLYIYYAYNKEITYWNKADLARVLNESEEKELVHLAP